MATVTMNTEAAIIVTYNYCYKGYFNCDDDIHVPPGGTVTYIDKLGTEQTKSGICGNEVITINAQSIVSYIGVSEVVCP